MSGFASGWIRKKKVLPYHPATPTQILRVTGAIEIKDSTFEHLAAGSRGSKNLARNDYLNSH